jgi:hypothetical protein
VKQPPGAVTYVQKGSKQLFLLFTGGRAMMVYPVLTFVKKTGIGGANFAIFRDATQTAYTRGVSQEIDSLDKVADWVRARRLDTFQHVEQVFAVGNSGGGGAALHVGHELGVNAVWSLAGLVPDPTIGLRREVDRRRFRRRFIGREEVGEGLTPQEFERLRAAEDDPEVKRWVREVDENLDVMLDRPRLNGLVTRLREQPKQTVFHFHYCSANAMDRSVAQAFEGCPNAELHPIEPPWGDGPEPPWSRLVEPPPSHGVVRLLDAKGELSKLFAGYV